MGMHSTGKYCPLDGAELYCSIEYGGSEVNCPTCGVDYKKAINSEEGMLERARNRATRLGLDIKKCDNEIEKLNRQRSELERLLNLAKEKGLITIVNEP